MPKDFKELTCGICGYTPDDDDIKLTDYNIKECDNCGKENVCDLCLYYPMEKMQSEQGKWGRATEQSSCLSCRPLYHDESGGLFVVGNKRKSWLADEYFIKRRKTNAK